MSGQPLTQVLITPAISHHVYKAITSNDTDLPLFLCECLLDVLADTFMDVLVVSFIASNPTQKLRNEIFQLHLLFQTHLPFLGWPMESVGGAGGG